MILKEGQSVNYTLVAAMTSSKFLGYMIFRGGIKKEDFFYFLIELIDNNRDFIY